MYKFVKPTVERQKVILDAMKRAKSYLGFVNKGILLNDMTLHALTHDETVTYVAGAKGSTYQIKITPLDTSGVPEDKRHVQQTN